jgi:predicted metal-binding membrane protein
MRALSSGDALKLLRRERQIVATALALITLVAALYILAGGGTGMSTLGMSQQTGPAGALLAQAPDRLVPVVWTAGYALIIFGMWWLMMVAMMVPSVAPTVLLFAALNRAGPAAALRFLAGYLLAWAGFSLLVTGVQGGLSALGLVSAMYMVLGSPMIAAVVLIAAGLYQFTPLKQSCLAQCRGPVDTLTRLARRGRGPLWQGLSHGTSCLGCCWALMALLFVGGIMNIWWILGLTLYVAVEKLAPGGIRLARIFGLLLILGGITLIGQSSGLL